MNRLAILGASGHGKVVADAALQAGWQEIHFFDDAWPSLSANGPWHVAGSTQELLARSGEFDGVVVGIGNCLIRQKKIRVLRAANIQVVSVIHPHACVSPYARLGIGCVVLAGAVINIDAEIGAGCIVNTGATVDHDCRFFEAVHICPGAHLSGDVTVGERSWIGVGASVIQGVRIGADTVVGAGAVVINPVASGLTVAGCPAAPLH